MTVLAVETWRDDAVREPLADVQQRRGDRSPIDAAPVGVGERIGNVGFIPWTSCGSSRLVVLSVPVVAEGRSLGADVPLLTDTAALRYADLAGCG